MPQVAAAALHAHGCRGDVHSPVPQVAAAARNARRCLSRQVHSLVPQVAAATLSAPHCDVTRSPVPQVAAAAPAARRLSRKLQSPLPQRAAAAAAAAPAHVVNTLQTLAAGTSRHRLARVLGWRGCWHAAQRLAWLTADAVALCRRHPACPQTVLPVGDVAEIQRR